uniref:Homeobox domain-containing protein n=1 Tax=Globodera pallida TaxID=36090 RepID=A0A183BP43_GLOPA
MQLFTTIFIIFVLLYGETRGGCFLSTCMKKKIELPETPPPHSRSVELDRRISKLERRFDMFLPTEHSQSDDSVKSLENRISKLEINVTAWFATIERRYAQLFEQQQQQLARSGYFSDQSPSSRFLEHETDAIVEMNDGKRPIVAHPSENTRRKKVAHFLARDSGRSTTTTDANPFDDQHSNESHVIVMPANHVQFEDHFLRKDQRRKASGPSRSEERMDKLWENYD